MPGQTIALSFFAFFIRISASAVTMSDSSSEDNVPNTSTGKKRVRDPVKWAKNIAKRKRNRGEAYTSRSTGRPVAARVMGPPTW